MSKEKSRENGEVLYVRVSSGTLARLEEFARGLEEKAPAGMSVSRPDAIRVLIERGLAAARVP